MWSSGASTGQMGADRVQSWQLRPVTSLCITGQARRGVEVAWMFMEGVDSEARSGERANHVADGVHPLACLLVLQADVADSVGGVS